MTVGMALRRTWSTATGPPTFTNTVAAFWAGDPSWSNPGDGNAVSSWRDYSGQGRDASQGTAGYRPIYRASVAALNGQPAVEFDKTDDQLATASFTATGTTLHTYLLIARTGATVSGTMIFAEATGAASFYRGASGAGIGKWNMYTTGADAGYPASSPSIVANTNYAVRTMFGTTDAWAINGTGYTPGGIDQVANALTDLALGSTTNAMGSSVAYFALIDANATADANWSSFVSWVSTTYGLTMA